MRQFHVFAAFDTLHQRHIKFRPNRPFSPHLNGKVERSQRTDRMEFWPKVDRKGELAVLEAQLAEWQRFYNEERMHYTLGKTPKQRLEETKSLIPTVESVKAAFDAVQEGYRTRYRAAWSSE